MKMNTENKIVDELFILALGVFLVVMIAETFIFSKEDIIRE
jgi:hypothetical protein